MRFDLLICAVVWHLSSSEARRHRADHSVALHAVSTSANTFHTNFAKHVATTAKGNLVCSSLSAWMVLSMASYGARGRTKSQMKSALALPPSDNKAKEGFAALIASFDDYKISKLRVGNKIFIDQSITLKSAFRRITREKFHSEVQNVNFRDTSAACKEINDWCEAQTNRTIKNLIKPDELDSSTVMVLANAVYFKGEWKEPFDPARRMPKSFYVNSTTAVDVPMMYKGEASYRTGQIKNLEASFVEIPYKSAGVNDELSMFILLPWEIDGLVELEEKLNQVTVDDLLGGTAENLDLYLPKFKIESEISLETIARNMGMTNMFSRSANFSGIADSTSVRISEILQKASIEVSEKGTVAAAATHARSTPLTIKESFSADHPFIGFIAAPHPSAVKLFSFRYTGPSDKDFYIGISSEEEKVPQPDRTKELRPVMTSANTFQTNFIKQVATKTKGNLVCSSLSAWMALSMASFGARGSTRSQMKSALALPLSENETKKGFEALVASFDDYTVSELRVANKIFVGQSITPKCTFKKITREIFRSEVQKVNFGAPRAACKAINDWCEDRTNRKIKNLMKPDELDSSTVMVLANAVYFKGKWKEPFDATVTSSQGFRVNSTTGVDIPVMYRKGLYNTGELDNLGASFIEIPYASAGVNDELSMFLLVPWETDGLVALEDKFNQVTVESLIAGRQKRPIELYLPKFKIESEIPLEPIVRNMGMTEMFSSKADFSGIGNSSSLSISEIVQKAFIEVSEEGREGAVVTYLRDYNLMGFPEFRALHPFMGFIAAPRPSAPKLFTFRYTGPTGPGLHYYPKDLDWDYTWE